MNNGKWTLRIITVLGVLAIILFAQLPKSPTSTPTEVIQVPADETPSDGGLVTQETLKAAGNKLAATARNFGPDCNAAELHTIKTGENTRCELPGGAETIFSLSGLPQDPAERSAEQPAAP